MKKKQEGEGVEAGGCECYEDSPNIDLLHLFCRGGAFIAQILPLAQTAASGP